MENEQVLTYLFSYRRFFSGQCNRAIECLAVFVLHEHLSTRVKVAVLNQFRGRVYKAEEEWKHHIPVS
jgi:hypothetical protein